MNAERSGATLSAAATSSPRVALLNPIYWPEARRGVERVLHDLGTGLADRGLQATLITSHPRRGSRAVEDGLEVIRNRRLPEGLLRLAGYPDRTGHLPLAYLSLRRGDYDLVHALYPTDALAAVRWASVTGRPVVFSVMGIPSPELLERRGLRWSAWRVVRDRSAAVLALSEAAATAIRALGAEPRVIHPGVDLDAFERNAGRSTEPTILCPAALAEPRKRAGLLLEAFDMLRGRGAVSRLILDRRHSRAALPEGVELRNLDRHEDLVRAYSESWATILPARREAFGLVLLESLACGTPVVGLNEGGIPEIIDRPEVGDLFEGDTPTAVAAAVERAAALAEDPRTPQVCRERAADFPVERWVDAHLDLYTELVEAGVG